MRLVNGDHDVIVVVFTTKALKNWEGKAVPQHTMEAQGGEEL
jgi:hypothetical protein